MSISLILDIYSVIPCTVEANKMITVNKKISRKVRILEIPDLIDSGAEGNFIHEKLLNKTTTIFKLL